MPLSIKNPRAEELAAEVTRVTGETLTEAVIVALEERLERLRGRRSRPDLAARLLIAVLLGEPAAPRLIQAIAAAPKRFVAAFSALEAAVVIEARKGPAGRRELDLLLHEAAVDVVPMDLGQVELAKDAYRRFGKGRHPAGLNLGDCCAYALAVQTGEALLFKGNDFAQTDVTKAV
jgi:ribonuclease VapC